MDDLYALYHVLEEGACGGIAFYSTSVLVDEDALSSETVRLVDGSVPVDGETPITCGTCQEHLLAAPLYWKRWSLNFESVKNGKVVTLTEEGFDAGEVFLRAEAWVEEHYPHDVWMAMDGRYDTLRRKPS